MTAVSAAAAQDRAWPRGPAAARAVCRILAVGASRLPFVSNDYWALIGTRAAIYWVLVSGLNLVVGFAGQLAIGYVALLTLGAYTTSVLVAGNVAPPPVPASPHSRMRACVGAVFGVIVGLPALRLRTFYFAMTTLGFATIVTQIALAWQSVTGGGIGVPGPEFPAPFDTAWGFYLFCLASPRSCTWMTANIAHSRFGRSLIAIRDAEVAAEATGISKAAPADRRSSCSAARWRRSPADCSPPCRPTSRRTPSRSISSVLFFIAILIGGRGSILGPLLGTIILTLLPEFAAPLVAWSTFLYARAAAGDRAGRCPAASPPCWTSATAGRSPATAPSCRGRPRWPNRAQAGSAAATTRSSCATSCSASAACARSTGSISTSTPGEVHGLIGPNGSGKTTTLNVISGYYAAQAGRMTLGDDALPPGAPDDARRRGIARTFQTPRVIGEASVLQNVMIGGTDRGATRRSSRRCSALPRHRRDERDARGQGARAAWRRRTGGAGRRARRSPAAQRTALHRDRPRADARSGLPAARRAGRRSVRRRDPTGWAR